MKLRRLTSEALESGSVTPQLERARSEVVPTFTHFLDIPILLVIVSLGTMQPTTWTLLMVGVTLALGIASTLTVVLPRLYPWTPSKSL
jgi:hypothetical protein